MKKGGTDIYEALREYGELEAKDAISFAMVKDKIKTMPHFWGLEEFVEWLDKNKGDTIV